MTPKRAAGHGPVAPKPALPGSVLPPDAPGTPPPAPSRAGGGTQDRENGPVPAGRSSLPGSATGTSEPGDLSPSLCRSVPRGVATGPQDPAGGAVDADAAPSDRSTGRTYTIALPAGLKLLSLNDRGHWAARYRRSQDIKKAACVMALKAKVPRLGRVSVVAEYQPPDRRRRDADNPVASVKAAIDGIVAAGILPGDESPRYVASVACQIGEMYPKGRLILHLTEVTT